jgi:hypothetical protein
MFLNSFYSYLVILIVLSSIGHSATLFDLTQKSVRGTPPIPVGELVCNKDTVIDFRLSANDLIK